MNVRSIGVLAMGCAIAGCVNLAPEHSRPELSTRADYDPDYRPDGSTVASSMPWQDYVVDPRLEGLIAAALENNRDLIAATARIEQARAQFRIQESQRYPTLGSSAAGTRSRTPLNLFGPGFGDGEGPSAIIQNRFDVSVDVTAFELDFWGRLRNLSEAARAEYLASVATQRAFYLSLIADVASVHYDIVESEEQIVLAQATARSRREGLRIAKLRLDAGVTSALDFNQAQTLLTQADQVLAAEQLALAQSRNQMAVLVGGVIPASLPPALPLGEQVFGGRLDAGLPSDLLLVRPDIIAAEEQLRARRASIGAARAAFFPNISLTGTGGFSSLELDSLFSGDSLTWSFGPSISLPIFDWGAREADLGLARARETEAVATYDLTVQQAFREVSDALAGRRWLAEQIDTRTVAVAAQEKTARIARLRYREGVANYLEVLDAERNLFAERQALLELVRLNEQNSVALYVALGGGLSRDNAADGAEPRPDLPSQPEATGRR